MIIPKLENRTPSGKFSPAAEHCAERATLSHAVANAITEEYLRKKAYEDARTKGDHGELIKSCGDWSLVQPSTVPPPPV